MFPREVWPQDQGSSSWVRFTGQSTILHLESNKSETQPWHSCHRVGELSRLMDQSLGMGRNAKNLGRTWEEQVQKPHSQNANTTRGNCNPKTSIRA